MKPRDDYFGGCHNVPMFTDGERVATCAYCGKPLAYIGVDQDNGPEAMRDKCWGRYVDHEPTTSLADVVKSIEARRVVAQLELPADLLPKPEGQLFA